MKRIFIIVAFALFLSGSVATAEELIIEASGEYVMDSRLDETPASATARAREEAKRAAVERAGVYVYTYSKTIDFELDEDIVQTVAARLLKIQSESSDVEVVEKNLLKFIVTIKALVDELNEADLKSMTKDRQALEMLTRQNLELQEKYDALNKQMKRYRDEFDNADAAQKVEIKKAVALNAEKFAAVDEVIKGNDFAAKKNFSQAMTAYDTAIRLDAQFAEAYNNRGIVKYELGQFSAAIEDYTLAVHIKPNYADALNNRGNAYANIEQFKNAERDLLAALKLNDKSAAAHNNLGSVYLSQKKFDDALKEYSRAIQIYPKYAEAYYNRAIAYYANGNLINALLDLKQALKLQPDDDAIKNFYEKINR